MTSEFGGAAGQFGTAYDTERGRFQAEVVAAIEATGELGWWQRVNYYRAVGPMGGTRHGGHP